MQQYIGGFRCRLRKCDSGCEYLRADESVVYKLVNAP